MILRVILGMTLFLGSLALGWWLHRRGYLTEARASRLVRFIVDGGDLVRLRAEHWTTHTLLLWAGADRCVAREVGSAEVLAVERIRVLAGVEPENGESRGIAICARNQQHTGQ